MNRAPLFAAAALAALAALVGASAHAASIQDDIQADG